MHSNFISLYCLWKTPLVKERGPMRWKTASHFCITDNHTFFLFFLVFEVYPDYDICFFTLTSLKIIHVFSSAQIFLSLLKYVQTNFQLKQFWSLLGYIKIEFSNFQKLDYFFIDLLSQNSLCFSVLSLNFKFRLWKILFDANSTFLNSKIIIS